LNLAGMDFKRKKLYVPFLRTPHAEALNSAHRKSQLEYFHVRFQPRSCRIYVS
jgi:hypothetical protein